MDARFGMESPKRDAMEQAKAMIGAGGTAALSVLDIDGGTPFTTLVNVAADAALRPLLLISSLAHHSKCLAKDPRASLMLHAPLVAEDPMLTFRVTLLGPFEEVAAGDAEAAFLARHPYAELYAGFGDFSYWRMAPEHAHIIAGFGRAYGVRFKDLQ
jgi:heme iron utilization protein